MSDIKRYDICTNRDEEFGSLSTYEMEEKDGEYVRYDDIKHLLTDPHQEQPMEIVNSNINDLLPKEQCPDCKCNDMVLCQNCVDNTLIEVENKMKLKETQQEQPKKGKYGNCKIDNEPCNYEHYCDDCHKPKEQDIHAEYKLEKIDEVDDLAEVQRQAQQEQPKEQNLHRKLGSGSYKCKECGETHYGSTIHYCEEQHTDKGSLKKDADNLLAKIGKEISKNHLQDVPQPQEIAPLFTETDKFNLYALASWCSATFPIWESQVNPTATGLYDLSERIGKYLNTIGSK